MEKKMPVIIVFIMAVFMGFSCSKKSQVSDEKLTDIDRNVYQTVKIGDQVWMAENLRVTHYRNGDAIPNVKDEEWSDLRSGAYCAYENDETTAVTYGYLYNWSAVNDSRNIAPAVWHVPTDEEWKTLEMVLGTNQSQADDIGHRGIDEGGTHRGSRQPSEAPDKRPEAGEGLSATKVSLR
jgi:uncharacterized protein (TIGR02145 family)